MKYFKLQYITLLILLILGVSLVPSCNKDKTPCTTCPTGNSNCEDIQNVKKFFAFKVGSWWVYEEETSGDRDSVYVTQYQNDPNNYNFDVRVYSTYQDYYYHYWPEFSSGAQSCSENGIICKFCVVVKFSKYKPGDFVDEIRCFYFIPELGQGGYESSNLYPNNRNETEAIFENYQLSNLWFDRTIVMKEDHSLMESYQTTKRFYSKNVGLIRKELLDSNQVWNLVDYYIQE